MTVEKMSIAIWEQLGEPSDLIPGTLDANGVLTYESSTTGGTKLLEWINRSIARIVSWKNKRGHIVRFRDLDERVFFQGYELTGTLQSASSTVAVLQTSASTVDGFYNGMLLHITSNTGANGKRQIVDYVGSTRSATVSRAFEAVPDGTSTYAINKDFYDFKISTDADVGDNILVDAKEKILTATKVKDLYRETELDYKTKTESFVGNSSQNGDPTEWWMEGKGLRFNIAPDDNRWFEANIRVLPEDVTTGTDIVQIPETFHEAIVMWCVWNGLTRDGDFNGAYAVKRNLEDYMETVINEQDLLSEEIEAQFIIDEYAYS